MSVRIDGFLMDVAISEQMTLPGEATSLAVEVGPNVSDHMRDLPEEFSLECVVSNTPIGQVLTGDDSRQGDGINEPLPARDALDRLRDIKAARRTVQIDTNFGTFDGIAILDVEVNAGTGKGQFDDTDEAGAKTKRGGIFFSAKCRRLHFVTNSRVKIRVKTPMAGGGGKSKIKVVSGSVLIVDHVVVWRHASPAGSLHLTGLTTLVDVVFSRSTGTTPQLTQAHMDAAAEEVVPGETTTPGLTREQIRQVGDVTPLVDFIRYFESGTPNEITGQNRHNLCLDLMRDQSDQRAAAKKAKEGSLPDGISTDRFKRGTLDKLGDAISGGSVDLSKFARKPVPTPP